MFLPYSLNQILALQSFWNKKKREEKDVLRIKNFFSVIIIDQYEDIVLLLKLLPL